jgi:hypothetical protein
VSVHRCPLLWRPDESPLTANSGAQKAMPTMAAAGANDLVSFAEDSKTTRFCSHEKGADPKPTPHPGSPLRGSFPLLYFAVPFDLCRRCCCRIRK